MSVTSLNYYAILIVAVVVALLVVRKKTKPPYPPGPKGLPLVGNIRDLPPSREWITYKEWSRQYGSDVIHLNLLGTHLLVVNTREAAFELFERRSVIYSDRPRMPMLELAGWDWTFGLYGYGNRWRTSRRLFHHFFNVSVVSNFEPQETKATHELLYRIVQKPDGVMEHLRLMAASLSLSVAYGIDAQSVNNPFVVMVQEAMLTINAAGNPGSFLVDSLPILKHVPEWFPFAGFKTMARKWQKCIQDTAEIPFQYVKDQMVKGCVSPSVASLSLEKLGGSVDKEQEEVIRGVSATIYSGGSDTTVSALASFVLAMVLHPDVVKKAQEELDRVVGQDRLPDFSDRDSLPYISAVVKETLRWNPVAPFGLPHRLMVDDIYNGKLMPGGSLVLGNIWAILHDENVYPEPERFNPDRFLKNGELDPDVRSPDIAFGFGRRSCAGKRFALSAIYVVIANMLATFDIEKTVDKDGKVIVPSGDYHLGLICHPMPFQCLIKPRSPLTLNLITEAFATHHP